MENSALLWLHLTLFTLTLAVAGLVWLASQRVSRSISRLSRYETLAGDLAALQSDFAKMLTVLRRIENREAQRDRRSEPRERPGTGSSHEPSRFDKVGIAKRFGLYGLTGPAFARRQLEIPHLTSEGDNHASA